MLIFRTLMIILLMNCSAFRSLHEFKLVKDNANMEMLTRKSGKLKIQIECMDCDGIYVGLYLAEKFHPQFKYTELNFEMPEVNYSFEGNIYKEMVLTLPVGKYYGELKIPVLTPPSFLGFHYVQLNSYFGYSSEIYKKKILSSDNCNSERTKGNILASIFGVNDYRVASCSLIEVSEKQETKILISLGEQEIKYLSTLLQWIPGSLWFAPYLIGTVVTKRESNIRIVQ